MRIEHFFVTGSKKGTLPHELLLAPACAIGILQIRKELTPSETAGDTPQWAIAQLIKTLVSANNLVSAQVGGKTLSLVSDIALLAREMGHWAVFTDRIRIAFWHPDDFLPPRRIST